MKEKIDETLRRNWLVRLYTNGIESMLRFYGTRAGLKEFFKYELPQYSYKYRAMTDAQVKAYDLTAMPIYVA